MLVPSRRSFVAVRLCRPDGRRLDGTHIAFHGRFPLTVSLRYVTESFDYSGLAQLQTVGSYWLCSCVNLTVLDCAGLTPMRSVGDYWLSGCTKLTSFDGSSSSWASSVSVGCSTAAV